MAIKMPAMAAPESRGNSVKPRAAVPWGSVESVILVLRGSGRRGHGPKPSVHGHPHGATARHTLRQTVCNVRVPSNRFRFPECAVLERRSLVGQIAGLAIVFQRERVPLLFDLCLAAHHLGVGLGARGGEDLSEGGVERLLFRDRHGFTQLASLGNQSGGLGGIALVIGAVSLVDGGV